MNCINCAKQNNQKIQMQIDQYGRRYICPECGFVLEWVNIDISKFREIVKAA